MLARENQPFIFASLALVLSFLLMIAFHSESDAGVVAAWVQAIGSIVAIIGAIYAIQLQHRLEAQRAQDAANEEWNTNLLVLIKLTESVRRDISDLLTVFDDIALRERFVLRAFDRSLCQCNFEALETFSINSLGDARVRIQFLYTRLVAKSLLDLVDDLIGSALGRSVIVNQRTKDALRALQGRLDLAIGEYRIALRS